MARTDLITTERTLPAEARAVADRIVESRGEVSLPFRILLHAPEMADRVAALGQVVRSGSSLTDADRELVTLATGRAIGCDFVWESHADAAAAAGIPAHTMASLREDRGVVEGRERTLVSFVDELCGAGVSDETFDATRELLGTRAVVELALTVGYYRMLGVVMRALEAC